VDKKLSDWCTPDKVALLAGYSPGVKDYEKKKAALISKLTVWKDHTNPELAALGEKLYWTSWSQNEAHLPLQTLKEQHQQTLLMSRLRNGRRRL
jgi:hypothetical protein